MKKTNKMNDMKLEVGQILYTKDGRNYSNGIISNIKNGKYHVKTEDGECGAFTESEIEQHWHATGKFGRKNVTSLEVWQTNIFHSLLLNEDDMESSSWVIHVCACYEDDAISSVCECAEAWRKHGDACEGTNIFKESSFKVYKIQ